MNESFLKLRLIYEDLPDLIELELEVRDHSSKRGLWAICGCFYESPNELIHAAKELLSWVNQPKGIVSLVSLHNTGLSTCSLQFYTIDRAGHARCCVQFRENQSSGVVPCDPTRQATLELITEIAAIERFAKECLHFMKKGAEAELRCNSG